MVLESVFSADVMKRASYTDMKNHKDIARDFGDS